MSALTYNLRQSINSTLDFFSGTWRKFYTACLWFTLGSLVMAVVVTLGMRFIFHPDSLMDETADNLVMILMEAISQDRYLGTANAVLTLNLGLFAALMLKNEISGFQGSLRLRDLAVEPMASATGWYFIFLIGLVALHAIFFRPPFGPEETLLGFVLPPSGLRMWVNNLVSTILLYLPQVLASYVILRSLFDKRPKLGPFVSAFVSALLLALIVGSTVNAVTALFGELVVNPIVLNVPSEFVAYVVVFCVFVALIAFTQLAAATAMMYPIKHRYEQLFGPLSRDPDPTDSLVPQPDLPQ